MAKVAGMQFNIAADSGSIAGSSLDDGLKLHQHVAQPGGSVAAQPTAPQVDSFATLQGRAAKPQREAALKDNDRAAGKPVRQ